MDVTKKYSTNEKLRSVFQQSNLQGKKELLDSLVLSIEQCIGKSYIEFNKTNKEPLSLVSGLSGCALFYAYAYKKFGEQRFLDKAYEMVDECIERIQEIKYSSLYLGFTGLAWVIRHLVNQGIFEKSSLEILDEIDHHIEKTMDVFSNPTYCSLVHGLMGHGVYFAEALRNTTYIKGNDVDPKKVLSKIVRTLTDSSIRSDSGITWIDNMALDSNKNRKVIHNLGLPHGIAGIALFLSEMIDLDVEIEISKELLEGSLKWLLSRKQNFSNISYYPSHVVDVEPAKMARLSWAYGDLCCSLALLKGYQHLGNEHFRNESFDTLMLTTKRDIATSLINTNVEYNLINPGICTGACGTILLYKALNDQFQHDVIDEKINFWIETMLNQFNTPEGSEYRSFIREKSKWGIDTGFLDGLSGVGLTLLSLSDPELSDWKRVLLL